MTNQTETIQACLLEKIGLELTSPEIAFHHRVGRGYRLEKTEHVHQAEQWLLRLLSANRQAMVYDDLSLRRVIGKVWFRVCSNSGPLGPRLWRAWRSSPLVSVDTVPVSDKLRFMASIVWHMARRTNKAIV